MRLTCPLTRYLRNFVQVLCKPKIMPIKSMTLEKMEVTMKCGVLLFELSTRIHACVECSYECKHICLYVYVCMYACMYICMYVGMYV